MDRSTSVPAGCQSHVHTVRSLLRRALACTLRQQHCMHTRNYTVVDQCDVWESVSGVYFGTRGVWEANNTTRLPSHRKAREHTKTCTRKRRTKMRHKYHHRTAIWCLGMRWRSQFGRLAHLSCSQHHTYAPSQEAGKSIYAQG